ncbi:MAG TPA: outer membrane lipoprotein carrier protein LolA [Pyrinomonadaceae bacterium]|nr:outer membrane lipoprotein carrier protein LolA [Pyrinomonadaceae bacterium]
MKRFLPHFVLIVALAMALSALPIESVNGQSAGLVSSVLSRMERNRQNLKSLRASISMEKYNVQLGVSEHYRGTVLYVPSGARQASVRIEWQSPQHEILAVSNGKYKLFRPRLNVVYEGNARSTRDKGGAGSILELMYLSRQQLEQRFQPIQDVREETLWGNVSTIHLKLVPKGNASFKYAEIWVDSSGMPVQTKIVEKNNDSTTMRLTATQRNIRIPSDQFNLKLDSSVKVVKG